MKAFYGMLIGLSLLITWIDLTHGLIQKRRQETLPPSNNATETSWEWLLGDWKRTNDQPGRVTTEHWKKDNDKKWIGRGLTRSKGKIVFEEKISFEKKGDDWYYIVSSDSNDKPVHFKITQSTKLSFVAENPKHDFPKKIVYRYDPENKTLRATISGGKNIVQFDFERVTK